MKNRQLRWIIAALSSGVLAWFAVRRRQSLIDVFPSVQEHIQERIVLPFRNFNQEELTGADQQNASPDELTRKVGRNRRISVNGKLYGPLEDEYIGRQVGVRQQESTLVVSFEGREIGSFPIGG